MMIPLIHVYHQFSQKAWNVKRVSFVEEEEEEEEKEEEKKKKK